MKRARGLQEQTSELQELRFQSCHASPCVLEKLLRLRLL